MISSLNSPSLLGPASSYSGFCMPLFWYKPNLLHQGSIHRVRLWVSTSYFFNTVAKHLTEATQRKVSIIHGFRGLHSSWQERHGRKIQFGLRPVEWGGKRSGERSIDICPQRPIPECRFFLLGPTSQGSHNSSN